MTKHYFLNHEFNIYFWIFGGYFEAKVVSLRLKYNITGKF
jgi:hypothetical protein